LFHIADNVHNFSNNQDIVVLFQKYPPRDPNWPNYWVATQVTGTPQTTIPAIQMMAGGYTAIHYFQDSMDQSISWAGTGNNYLNYGQYGGDMVYLKRVYSNDGGKTWSTYV
jgi:hypothetical protein